MESLATAKTGESPPDWFVPRRAEADMAPFAELSYAIERLLRANYGTVGNPVLRAPVSFLLDDLLFTGGRHFADRLNHLSRDHRMPPFVEVKFVRGTVRKAGHVCSCAPGLIEQRLRQPQRGNRIRAGLPFHPVIRILERLD